MRNTIILLALVALVPSVFGQNCYTCLNVISAGNCSSLEGVATMACPAGEAGCYRFEFEDGRVNRGCLSSLTETEANNCRTGTTGCKTCVGDLCNGKVDFQHCHRCDGVNCPQIQGATENLYTCNAYLDECGIQIVDGLTRRGCVQEMTNFPETCNALTCSRCTGTYCNQGVFPANRLQCNVCTGTTDECFNAMTDMSTRRVCDSYVISGDQCYTALDSQRQVYRGCLSNGGPGQTICAGGGNCQSCFQAGCNSAAARSAPLLSCIKCATTDVACAWGFRANEAEMCVNQVYMGESEACLERVMWDGSVQRGCYLDIFGNCADNDDTCSLCTGHGCNRLSDKSHTCYQCQSSADESCRERVEEDLEATACVGNDQRLADKGCYTLVQDNGHVVRGCLNYMDADLMAMCQTEGTCQVCNEDGCNAEPVEGAAGAMKALSVGLLALLAVCVGMF